MTLVKTPKLTGRDLCQQKELLGSGSKDYGLGGCESTRTGSCWRSAKDPQLALRTRLTQQLTRCRYSDVNAL